MKGVLTLLLLAGIAAVYLSLPARPRSVPAGPTERQHHYSEPGIAYTTDYVALHLAGGVTGIAPGTRLTECLDAHMPGKQVVSDGAHTFAVEPQMLTHDIDLAHELAAADVQGQGSAASSLARSQEQRAASAYNANLLTAQDVEQINAAAVAASTVGNYDSALHRPVAPVGAYGSYGGGGGGGYTYYRGGTIINNVTVNQYGSGAGSRGGGAGTASSGPGVYRYVPARPTPARGVTGPVAGSWGAAGTGLNPQ